MGPTLDQGSTPHCVGFSGAGWGNCLPVDDEWPNGVGHDLYYECKVIDGEPGEESGSYVRSLAKALKNRGRLDAYAFGSVDDAHQFILSQGPVVFGIDWYEDMFYPDYQGTIHPTGPIVGGHAILAFGASPTHCYLANSWGDGWGLDGACRMSWFELREAFGRWGEAMAAVELPAGYDPKPVPKPWYVRLWHWFLQLFGRG